MFEELNQHRAAVAEQIQKACEIGFTGNELEKAHNVGDIHPNGKWVWTQLPSGKYDWRVIKKTGAPSGGAASAAGQGKKEEGGPKTFVDEKYGRKDKFEVVDEWPSGGYKVWNIGRSNFPHEGYIPLAQSTPENKYVVKLDTLKALKVGDEDLCLKVLKAAGQKGVDEEKFNKLKEEHKGKSPEKKEEPGKEALSEISKK